jgi:hypothetical protein
MRLGVPAVESGYVSGDRSMRKLVIIFTLLLILLSVVASLTGALSYGQNRFRTFTTMRGEVVDVQDAGVYRNSLRVLVTSGIPWDIVTLLVGIPLLVVSFVLYLRGSLRGTALFIGGLTSFLYQYLLWTFDWAYNSLFLVYVALFSLSLWTLILVLTGVDGAQVRKVIGEHFPLRTAAGFSLLVGGMLIVKCLGEILPSLGSSAMPAGAAGYYTMVDQALDLGLLAPFCVVTGVLLLRRVSLGYLLCPSLLIVVLCIGLSVVTGEAMLGLSTAHVNVAGLAVFTIFMTVALWLLVAVLANMRTPSGREILPLVGAER